MVGSNKAYILNKEVYNKAVSEYNQRLRRFIAKFLKDDTLAKDVVQDTFAKLWINKDKIDPAKVKSWLFSTAYNTMINQIKRESRYVEMEDQVVDIQQVRPEVFKKEAEEVVQICIKYLPELQRSILLLRDLEGYEYKEIGEMLGISDSQVKVYLFRARSKMKEYVLQLLPDGYQF